jgi:nucleoside phosphorylase
MYKIKAVEMEGSGIADASWECEKAGYLIVRGICDYCDARNKGTQTDAWKPYVAMAAAAYVRALLEVIPGEATER